MRRTRAWLALVTLALGLATSEALFAQESGPQPRRVALLVGINHYQRRGFEDLHWAERDVDELKLELQGLGFDKVVTMRGSDQGDLLPTKDHIKTQLVQLLEAFTKDDIALVALCGHGQQLFVKRSDGTEREDGFFCPVNAVLNDPDTMVSLSDLTDNVLNSRGGKNLLLVDACRDGVVDSNRAVRMRGIQGRLVALPEDTAILFSCRAGQQSPERDDLKHGVFTYCVVQALRQATAEDGDFTWSALVNGVQNGVARLNPGQEPIAAGAIGRVSLGRRSAASEELTNSIGMKFKLIRPGTFWMGSLESPEQVALRFPGEDAETFQNEVPRHKVTLSNPFYMGMHEVTLGQFRRFVDETGYQTDAERGRKKQNPTDAQELVEAVAWRDSGHKGITERHPVSLVSWNDAVAFCRWLSTKERRTYRMPTQAEWEYCCRAGTSTRYWTGDDPESLAAGANVPDASQARGETVRDYSFGYYCGNGSYGKNGWIMVSCYPGERFEVGIFHVDGRPVWEHRSLQGKARPAGTPIRIDNVATVASAAITVRVREYAREPDGSPSTRLPRKAIEIAIPSGASREIVPTSDNDRQQLRIESDDGFPELAPVGSLKPNAFGLYDTHGNVWEWCGDEYDSKGYEAGEAIDPVEKSGSNLHVIRGGCFL